MSPLFQLTIVHSCINLLPYIVTLTAFQPEQTTSNENVFVQDLTKTKINILSWTKAENSRGSGPEHISLILNYKGTLYLPKTEQILLGITPNCLSN